MAHSHIHAALFGLLLAAPVAATATQADRPVLDLAVNQQQPMQLPANLERVAIADPSVADLVSLDGKSNNVLLVGKAPGHTTLLMWLRGQNTPQRYELDVRSAVQKKLLDGTTPDTALTMQGDTALLSGNAPSLLQHQQSMKAARAGGVQTPLDASVIATSPVVQVDVKVVEFNKTAMRQVGLNLSKTNGGFSWGFGPRSSGKGDSGSIGGSGSAVSSAFSLVYQSAHNFLGSLDLMEGNGMARVLAEPSLVALSGQSASFLAGGELPVPQAQGLGATSISYKPFGIGLTVTPTVLDSNRIALKVAPEVSDLDYSNGLEMNGVQMPSISTRRADTTVELGDGESFVIGGLVSRSTSSQVSQVPLLGDIPVIGAFFRDLKYKKEDKELVIIVTPHLVNPIAKGTPLPLPGQKEVHRNMPVWGAWILGPASTDQLPGFSR